MPSPSAQMLIFIVCAVVDTAGAGFDWGAGCAGGSGSFTTELNVEGSIIDVGSIPKGW